MSEGYVPLSAAIIERALLDYKQALSEKDEGTIANASFSCGRSGLPFCPT